MNSLYLDTLDFIKPSGAYVFRPEQNTPTETSVEEVIEEMTGTHLSEWRVKLDVDWASYIIRKYNNEEGYEIEWMVGPLPSETTKSCD